MPLMKTTFRLGQRINSEVSNGPILQHLLPRMETQTQKKRKLLQNKVETKEHLLHLLLHLHLQQLQPQASLKGHRTKEEDLFTATITLTLANVCSKKGMELNADLSIRQPLCARVDQHAKDQNACTNTQTWME